MAVVVSANILFMMNWGYFLIKAQYDKFKFLHSIVMHGFQGKSKSICDESSMNKS
jgi:hypothetical protein